MYHSNVSKITKEITGHRSECVRTSKRTNDDIREMASKTIAGKSSKEQGVESVESVKKEVEMKGSVEDECKVKSKTLSVGDMIKNVIRMCMEMHKKKQKSWC